MPCIALLYELEVGLTLLLWACELPKLWTPCIFCMVVQGFGCRLHPLCTQQGAAVDLGSRVIGAGMSETQERVQTNTLVGLGSPCHTSCQEAAPLYQLSALCAQGFTLAGPPLQMLLPVYPSQPEGLQMLHSSCSAAKAVGRLVGHLCRLRQPRTVVTLSCPIPISSQQRKR